MAEQTTMTPDTDITGPDLSDSFSFLSKVHQLITEGDSNSIPIWAVGENLGLPETNAEEIASELQELNMLHYTSLVGDVALTSFGVSEIILARSQPDMPTTHFPALATFTDQMMLSFDDGPEVMDLLSGMPQPDSQQPNSRNDLQSSINTLEKTLKTRTFSQSLVAELEEIQWELCDQVT